MEHFNASMKSTELVVNPEGQEYGMRVRYGWAEPYAVKASVENRLAHDLNLSTPGLTYIRGYQSVD